MNVGVFFGSGSVEHDISIITAQLIIASLKGLGFKVVPIYITKHGRWMLGEELSSMKLFSDPNSTTIEEGKLAEYFLDLEKSVGRLVFKKKGLTGKEVSVDLAFPALHGTFGEDGSLQGMFEMYGVPYVGCNVPASALSMDKALTKIVMSNALIPITKFIHFSKYDWQNQNVKIKNQIAEQLKYPLFVKPVHLGSSIGIGKVKDEKDLEKKIEVALYYDNKVLVEEGVEDVLDITCCVIGNNELTASVLQESVFAQDMFSFEDKYLKDGGAQIGKAQNSLVIPARLSPEITKDIQETAKAVYKALGCSGIARVDFLVERSTNKFYANEVNPLPGTLYHHLWKASGLELPELLTKLIGFAKEKQEEKLQTNYSFESSVLKNLGGGKVKGGKFPL